MFIGCEAAKQVWQVAGLWDIIMEAVAVSNFAECIFQLLCRCSKQKCHDIAMILWCLWRRRNDKVWEGEMKDVQMAVYLAREVLKQWQVVQEKTVQQKQVATDAELYRGRLCQMQY